METAQLFHDILHTSKFSPGPEVYRRLRSGKIGSVQSCIKVAMKVPSRLIKSQTLL
jgi:hypothetical protein